MVDQYTAKELDKIFNDKNYPHPLNLAMISAWIMGNKKGINLKIIDVQGKSSLTDYFILCSCANPTQSRAIADDITESMRNYGQASRSKEGTEDAEWILLDFNSIIINIFLDRAREFYDLDKLWSEAPMIEIPQEFYSSEPQSFEKPDSSDGYF